MAEAHPFPWRLPSARCFCGLWPVRWMRPEIGPWSHLLQPWLPSQIWPTGGAGEVVLQGSKGATGPYVRLWGWNLGPHLAEQGVGRAVCPLASGGHEPSFVGCQRAPERHCLADHAMCIGELLTFHRPPFPTCKVGRVPIPRWVWHRSETGGLVPCQHLCIWWLGLWPAPLKALFPGRRGQATRWD